MSRFELGGYEGPIPNIALPDPKLSPDMPVQSLVLPDGTNFEKSDWVGLGYTHYEVWCVGAAGGMGAEVGDISNEMVTNEQVPMPDWLWEKTIEGEIENIVNVVHHTGETYTYETLTSFPVYEYSTVPGHTGEVVVRYITPRQKAIENLERWNPNHLTQVTHHHDPYVISNNYPSTGGGGGGGGLHVISGALADLPDSVPVTVGVAGADALPGQILSPDPYDVYAYVSDPSRYLADYYYWNQDPRLRDEFYFENKWPSVGDPARPLFLPGQSGDDGGYSAFGDICMASGGKGGGPAIVWVANKRMFAAHGGEGGVGGRTQVGGGAAGSTDSAKDGKDGNWNGTVGQGGGGGRGGMSEIKIDVYSRYNPQLAYYG